VPDISTTLRWLVGTAVDSQVPQPPLLHEWNGQSRSEPGDGAILFLAYHVEARITPSAMAMAPVSFDDAIDNNATLFPDRLFSEIDATGVAIGAGLHDSLQVLAKRWRNLPRGEQHFSRYAVLRPVAVVQAPLRAH